MITITVTKILGDTSETKKFEVWSLQEAYSLMTPFELFGNRVVRCPIDQVKAMGSITMLDDYTGDIAYCIEDDRLDTPITILLVKYPIKMRTPENLAESLLLEAAIIQ